MIVNGWEINTLDYTLRKDGKCLKPGPKRYRLLLLLANNPGKVMSYDEMLSIYRENPLYLSSHSVTQAISQLRQMIGKEAILTRFSFGYYIPAELVEDD